MSVKRVFNPFTQNFDIVQDLTTLTWKDPVDTFADLPTSGNNENDARFVKDLDKLYVWTIPSSSGDISNWKEIGSLSGVAPHGQTHLPNGTDPVYTVIYENQGKIGIGIASPSESLEVNGNVKVNGSLIADYVNKIASKLVDENNIGDGRVLMYNSVEDKIVYSIIAKYIGDGEIEIFAL